jgi:hypothetical protein
VHVSKQLRAQELRLGPMRDRRVWGAHADLTVGSARPLLAITRHKQEQVVACLQEWR